MQKKTTLVKAIKATCLIIIVFTFFRAGFAFAEYCNADQETRGGAGPGMDCKKNGCTQTVVSPTYNHPISSDRCTLKKYVGPVGPGITVTTTTYTRVVKFAQTQGGVVVCWCAEPLTWTETTMTQYDCEFEMCFNCEI